MGHNLVPECGIMILFGWFHYSDFFLSEEKTYSLSRNFPIGKYPIEHGYL